MVTTRSKTSSLPAKRAPEQDSVAPASKKRTVASNEKDVSSTKKRSAAPKKAKSTTKTTKSIKQSQTLAAAASIPNTGRSNTLFDLPSELRNEIYYAALVSQTPIYIRTRRPYVLEPALLAVNRQIRNEVLSIFWSENIFLIHGSSPAMKFLRSLSDEQLSSLRTLRIVTDAMPLEYQIDRIRHFLEQFGTRGLSRQTIRFCAYKGNTSAYWYCLDDLKRLLKEQRAAASSSKDAEVVEDGARRVN